MKPKIKRILSTFRSLLRISILSVFAISICMVSKVGANEPWAPSGRLLDAIWLAEGGKEAKVEYGLITCSYCTSEPGWCRSLARDFIQVHHSRWNGQGDFITYLASKWAPIGAKNDPTGLNRHWKRNVLHWYNKLGGTNEMHNQAV